MLGRWSTVLREQFHPMHERMVDPRLRGQRRVYLYQALIATAVLVVVIWVEDLLSNTAIFAAIASTAFVLFVTPRSLTASPRHVIGGHAMCVVSGLVMSAIIHSSLGDDIIGGSSFLFATAAALAVGLGIILMGLTETEHPPAAGTALGMALVEIDWELILVLLSSVALMSLVRRLVLPRLRNLL